MKAALKLRAVLDTNVLVSALGIGGVVTEQIWELVEDERFNAFVSPWILEEFRRNLIAKAGFSIQDALETVEYVAGTVGVVETDLRLSIIREKDSDNRILECAVEARAEVIVTGDLKHIRPLNFFKGIEILTPREFLDKYFPLD